MTWNLSGILYDWENTKENFFLEINEIVRKVGKDKH